MYFRPSTELGSLLGEGAFARVVMGLDRTTLQQYAVKVIEKQSDDAQGLEFIWRELNVMKAVNHPNIVRTYDIFDTRTRLYIVLEYMPGGTLADLLKHTGRFTEAQARPVLRDILRGVAYLHSKSVVHRDLKLKNILCDRRELPVSVKLAGTLWFERGTGCWGVGAMTTWRDGPCCVCVSASCLVCIRDVLTIVSSFVRSGLPSPDWRADVSAVLFSGYFPVPLCRIGRRRQHWIDMDRW